MGRVIVNLGAKKSKSANLLSYTEVNMLHDGLVGIIAGIITTWILFVGKAFWETKVIPYLQEVRYQGVKIDGAWSGHVHVKSDEEGKVEGFETDSRLFLIQSAHKLTGAFTFSFQNDKKNFTLDFNVNGYMWEGYITLNFLPKDRRITSYGTALFKLHDGGHSLIGEWCFRDVEAEKVVSIPMSIVRQTK
jgi:hypothetical protein